MKHCIEVFQSVKSTQGQLNVKLRTIHDVKFHKTRDVLLQRDGSEFPGLRASESSFTASARTLGAFESYHGVCNDAITCQHVRVNSTELNFS